ncbi:hypothetical protein SASPL_119751 [Salvia splendens]|uniref:Copper transport protein n=1 Tax=Salvia splendens TaxID=180675 RepID=A0A8X8ZUM9_SALSN|nr:copper transporter 1-like [Salvia splendens]KAG6417568.1 hypothetical protein SASPL_119751 [Salvia splendens]
MDHNMPGMDNGDGGHAMTFFWGKNSEVLFSGWPGPHTGMYVLALFFVFALAFIVELLSSYLEMANEKASCGLVSTLVHGLRVGLAYLVMLALMSFNAGVFIVAVAGHSLGPFVFGSRVFKRFCGHSESLGYRWL